MSTNKVALSTSLGVLLAIGLTTNAAHAAPATPIAVIAGDQTELDEVWGVTASSDGTIYVANKQAWPGTSGDVLIFAAGSEGNVAPLAHLADDDGDLGAVTDVELDADGNIYVAAQDEGLYVFAAGSTGNVTPLRHIIGHSIYGLAIDDDGVIYSTAGWNDPDAGDVFVFAAGADGSDEPIAQLEGNGDSVDVAVDELGNIYLSDYGANQIQIWYAGAETGDSADRTIIDYGVYISGAYGIEVDCSFGSILLGGESSIVARFSLADPSDANPEVFAEDIPSQGLGLGQDGNLYVTNFTNDSVSIFEWTSSCEPISSDENLADTGFDARTALIFAGVMGMSGLVAVRRRRV